MAYRYQTIRARGLREGDEIMSADGKTWLSPIRPRGAVVDETVVLVWTDTKPGYGPPDLRPSRFQRIKVRRARQHV